MLLIILKGSEIFDPVSTIEIRGGAMLISAFPDLRLVYMPADDVIIMILYR